MSARTKAILAVLRRVAGGGPKRAGDLFDSQLSRDAFMATQTGNLAGMVEGVREDARDGRVDGKGFARGYTRAYAGGALAGVAGGRVLRSAPRMAANATLRRERARLAREEAERTAHMRTMAQPRRRGLSAVDDVRRSDITGKTNYGADMPPRNLGRYPDFERNAAAATRTMSKAERAVWGALQKARGGTLSKRQILRAVYGDGADEIDERVADVLIGKVRKKLQAAAGEHNVVTDPGKGYRYGA